MNLTILFRTIAFGCVIYSPLASAVFIDGNAHYGLRPETQTNPGFQDDLGLRQGIFQSFRLLGKVRANDQLDLNLEFRIFENPRSAYLGDHPQPEQCAPLEPATTEDGQEISDDANHPRSQQSNRGATQDCQGRHQNTGEPGYEPYQPKLTEVYAKYAFDYCLLEVGRRGRDWGLGIFLDSGRDPFETSSSIFDGATCNINIQKVQTLGFSVGFDKLAETGASVDVGLPEQEAYGPYKTSDDLDQLFFTIEYDDRQANAGSWFKRQIGIYFANVFGTARVGENDDKAKTDLKFADLYTAFYIGDFTLRNEVLFRLGRSADPSWARYGGTATEADNKVVKNDLNAIGFAGDLTYTIHRSGSLVGPAEYHKGTASSHAVFAEYAVAPGDRDGYHSQYSRPSTTETKTNRSKSENSSTNQVKAIAFHRNYKPALILFNATPELDGLRVDGAFDPDRVMNANVFTVGYRYKSVANGNFTLKLVSAELSTSIPAAVKDQIFAEEQEIKANKEDPNKDCNVYQCEPDRRPIGYSGKHLGYELDLSYSIAFGKNVELGSAAAVALPGPAWKTRAKNSPEISYLLQGMVTFTF